MRRIDRCAILLLAGLLAGCGVTGGQVQVGERGADGSIILKGYYSDSSHTAEALEASMKSEADAHCPGGWSKISDTPNAYALAGGRVWRIKCTGAPTVSAAAPAPAPPSAAAPVVAAPPATAAETAAPAVLSAEPGAAAGPSAVSRQELVRLLTISARSAAPDVTEEAVAREVAAELRALVAARIGVVGPDGQSIVLAP